MSFMPWWRLGPGCCFLVVGLVGPVRAGDQPVPAPKESKRPPGGTILIYEFHNPQQIGGESPDPQELIQALRRRIDPADLYNLTIRPVGKQRIEIILPTGGDGTEPPGKKHWTADDVRRVKELIAGTGTLEFRIVANGQDDKEAIDQARQYLEEPKNRTELEKAQEQGTPPPPPRDKDGSKKAFLIQLNQAKCTVTYAWVEIGPQERRQMNLDNDASKDEARDELWRQAAEGRKDGKAVQVPSFDALLYSRECRDLRLPPAKRKEKQFEYFLLTRDPEEDAKGKPQAITGDLLSDVRAAEDSRGRPVVNFRFNTEGGRRLRELTRKNLPTGEGRLRRHLAIVLDGSITSTPAIQAEIGAQGQISGRFTPQQVENLVNILRAGALPAALKPIPVHEETIPPDDKKEK